MLIRLLKAKIHRATVTLTDVNYHGSITIDVNLLRASGLLPNEAVIVADCDNGNRFETYTILGEPGSGDMCLNGAAARLVHPGDKIIVITYADYEDAELEGYEPTVVHVDERNRAITVGLGQAPGVYADPEPAPVIA